MYKKGDENICEIDADEEYVIINITGKEHSSISFSEGSQDEAAEISSDEEFEHV